MISNAGAFNTFSRMLDSGDASREQDQLTRCRNGASTIILFLGLNDDPRNHGFDDSNYWIYNSLNAKEVVNSDADPFTNVEGAFLSFGSLRNPGQSPHTAQIISFSDYDLWNEFSASPWKKRGDRYESIKDQVSEAMLDFTCRQFPQLKDLIAFQELSTPLSVESFTKHRGGMVYGQPCTPDRLFENSWRTNTSVKGLYLTGSDVGMPGVNGAMMGGVMTAARILGVFGFPRIFATAYSN
ncbi:MAG: hypothetical protein R3C03_03915 [Pirellulaceae bacterium]